MNIDWYTKNMTKIVFELTDNVLDISILNIFFNICVIKNFIIYSNWWLYVVLFKKM